MLPLDVDALALEGTTVIEASAGTGKTYTITSLFLRLLVEQRLGVDQILVVTYTRAATAELRERVRNRLRAALECARGEPCEDSFVKTLCQRHRAQLDQLVQIFSRALANVDQAPILTIHAFCQRVLRDHAFESGSGFGLKLTAYAAPIVDEIADDYFTAQLFDTEPARARLLCNEGDVLRSLAARVAGGPGLRIVPEILEQRALSLSAWREAQATCAELWRRDRAQILATVHGLKGVVTKHVERWGQHMDALLSGDAFGVSADKHDFNKGFAYFTRSGAQPRTKTALPAFFAAAERLLAEDSQLMRALTHEKAAFRAGFARYLGQELDKRARESEVRTFDALLSELLRALSGERADALVAALRKSYRAALVDEFQDTDPAQYRIFRRIFGAAERPLFLIGDPKQAIYAFRGADVQAYLEARSDAGEHVYTLDVNRRSDTALVAALNALYTRAELPFLRAEIAYQVVRTPAQQAPRFFDRDGRAPLDIAVLEGPTTEDALRREIARKVAADIADLLNSGARRIDEEHGHGRKRELVASDIAVLCRTNKEAYEVQLALSALRVPAVLSGDSSVFDSEDAEHIERSLSALAHPADPRALRSFLCSIYGGFSAEQLVALDADDADWDAHARNFRELHESFVSRGFTQALRALCARYRVEERLLARPDGLRRLTNLDHLGELLAEVSLTERLGPLGLLRWLETARKDAAARAELVGESHELRLESSHNAIRLTTVHKSKGLEYPIVYCPFLFKPATLRADEKILVRYHDPVDGTLTLDVGSDTQKEHARLAEAETLSEALRLLYVALTRAKHRVVLVLPLHKPSAQAALVYTLLGGGGLKEAALRLEQAVEAGGVRSLLERSARSGAGLSVRELSHGARPQPASLALTARETLVARTSRRVLDSVTRVASFSSLVAQRAFTQEPAADYDALPRSEPQQSSAPSPLTLDSFPRGAGPGKLIHEVLERCDFDASADRHAALIEQVTLARGYAPSLAPVLAEGLHEMLLTPLDEAGLTLAQVPQKARLNELEFLFPVTTTLTPKSLARCFRAHGAPPAEPGYARALEGLSFEALRGHLRGFIDLVFEHQGRYYLVDYKSNRLGPEPGDYDGPALVRALAEHHYFLQYHLYTVALHRYLGRRLPGYDYARHFGGVFYLFLRGMSPAHARGTGVFFDLPTQTLVEALDRRMLEEERSGTEEVS